MISLLIDPEYKNLIPSLTASEYQNLERSIKAEGCREPIILWHGVIIDGHNRYDICHRLGIPFKTEEKEFSCREEAISWICLNQLSRRNITEETRKYLIGKRYEAEKKLASKRNANGINQYTNSQRNDDITISQDIDSTRTGKSRRTSEILAEEYHLCHTTVEQYGQYSRVVDEIGRKEPSIVPKLLSGEYRFSYDNTRRLAQMPKPDVSALPHQMQNGSSLYVPRQSNNHGKNDVSEQQNNNRADNNIQQNVKSKPLYDPDAEINGLTLTIPTWMNSINRVQENTALDQISEQARGKLIDALKELQSKVANILEKVGA